MEFKACDFTSLIAEKKRDYYDGTRLWVFDDVQKWQHSDSRVFWLVGDAGTGKSVVTAKLFDLPNVRLAAWHFCRHDNVAQSDPRVILASWFAMLRTNLPGFKGDVDEKKLSTGGPLEMFETLIAEPLNQLPTTTAPCVIVMDALDELPGDALSAVLQLLTDAFDKLPKFVKVFVTSRDYPAIKQRLSRFSPLTLKVDDIRNLQDLRSFLGCVARRYVDMEFKLSDLEVNLEKHFKLSEESLKDKLAPLQEPIEKSLEIYGLVAERVKNEPGYSGICQFSDIPSVSIQSESDFDKLYEDAVAARVMMMNLLASEWAVYKTVDEGKTVLRIPAPAKAAPWVDNVIDPGLKGKESAARKIRDSYSGDARRMKDLARFTATCVNCARMERLICHLKSQSDLEIVGLRNKYVNPSPMGYRDFNLSVRVRLTDTKSHICELQVNIEDMLVAKERAHCHYETVRLLTPRICQEANISDKQNEFEAVLMKLLQTPALYQVLQALEDKAGGLFLYASLLDRQLETEQNLEKKLNISELQGLPSGLDAIYQTNFDRMVQHKSEWRGYSQVIAMIVASRESLPGSFIIQDSHSDFAKIIDKLAVLFPLRDGVFHVMHKTVVEWLRNPAYQDYYISDEDIKLAHSTLADKMLSQPFDSLQDHCTRFSLCHVLHHLCQAGRAAETRPLLTNLRWLLARVQVSSPETLIEDVSNAAKALNDRFLRLLASALQLGADAIRSNWRFLPAQLVGRLTGYEHKEQTVSSFLDTVREWEGPEDGRGWWCPLVQSLEAAGGPCLFTCAHPGGVWCAKWNPVTPLICSATKSLVRIFDGDTGKLLQTFSGHTDIVRSVCWSPDGKMVCSGSNDKTARVWDVQSGQCIRVLAHPDKVNSVVWTEKSIYTAEDKRVCLWDTENGICLHAIDEPNQRICGDLSGRIYVLNRYQEGAKVYVDGLKTYIQLPPHKFIAAAWSEDGRLATSDLACNVVVWIQSGDSYQRTCSFNNQTQVTTLGWANKNMLCLGGGDNAIRMWELVTGKCVATLVGHGEFISSISCRQDGRICSSSHDFSLRVWDTSIVQECESLSHTENVTAISWSTDGKVCSAGRDSAVRVWDLETRACQVLKHPAEVLSLTCTGASQDIGICTGSSDGIRVWDSTGKCIMHAPGFIWALGWIPDGRVCSADADGKVDVWDVKTGESTHTFYDPKQKNVWSICFSAHKACIAYPNEIHVWDLSTKIRQNPLVSKFTKIESITLISDTKICVRKITDDIKYCPMEAEVFDILSGKCVWTGNVWPRIAPLVELTRFFDMGKLLPLGMDSDMRYAVCSNYPMKALAQIGSNRSMVHVLQLRGKIRQMYSLPMTEFPIELLAENTGRICC